MGVCINGDGDLANKLGISKDSVKDLDDIKDAQSKINNAKNEFENKLTMETYSYIMTELEDRKDFKTSSFSLFNENPEATTSSLNLGYILGKINDDANTKSQKEKWTIDCNSEQVCGPNNNDDSITHSEEICFQPKYCLPLNRDWVPSSDIKQNAQIISDMKTIIDKAFQTNTDSYKYFYKSLEELGTKYSEFLKQYITALTHFNNTIDRLTSDLNRYTGDDAGIFSLINCNFIGKNIKVMLKFLKEALGGDVYTIGVCLILVGCSLALSISFTIFLIVVINVDIENNKKKNDVPEYALNSGGRVIQYK